MEENIKNNLSNKKGKIIDWKLFIDNKFSIHDEERVIELLEKNGHKKFRYAQIENAIYKNDIDDFDEIQTISKDLRELLKNNCYFYSLEIVKTLESEDNQTTKFALSTFDWKEMEAVIMRHKSWRITLCVSSQVWCPMACTFCATGKLWLIRNLESSEIIEQIMIANKRLEKEQAKIRNVVFMWMWEPLLNYPNVKKTIETFVNQKKINLSSRRVTISTCWIVPWIKKLWDDFPQVSLAISLHAPNDEARLNIMPVNHTYPIKDLMNALDEYVDKTNKRIFYEYIMIAWSTDNIEYAAQLWKLLKWKLAHVNFIPYNPWEWTSSDWMKPTSRLIIDMFQRTLDKYWVPSTVRHTMWDDIAAACWQLANKDK